MSEIKALETLRTAARNMAKGRNLENHEECNLLLLIADEIEAEIAERFVELPVDEDGITIHVGDVVQGFGDSGPVQRLELWDGNWVVVFEYSPGQFTRYSGDAVHHVKPRTLEGVLRDYGDEYHKALKSDYTVNLADIYCKYAAEIRELLGVSE